MWLFNGVALMPTTAKILKGGGHQVTNTAGTNERFAERDVCREEGVRSWKRWPPWKTHWGKRASYYLSFNVRFLSPLRTVGEAPMRECVEQAEARRTERDGRRGAR